MYGDGSDTGSAGTGFSNSRFRCSRSGNLKCIPRSSPKGSTETTSMCLVRACLCHIEMTEMFEQFMKPTSRLRCCASQSSKNAILASLLPRSFVELQQVVSHDYAPTRGDCSTQDSLFGLH